MGSVSNMSETKDETSITVLSRATALALTLLGFGLRIFRLDSESLWYDELLQADLARDAIPIMLNRLTAHSAVPLDYLISHLWMFFGADDFWMRVPAVVAGTLTLPVAFQLGRRLLGTNQGLLFMALLTMSPFHVRFSQELRPYALVVLGVTLFVYFVWRLRSRGDWRYLLPIGLATLIFSTSHYFANAIVGPLLVFLGLDALLARFRQRNLRALVAVCLAGLLAVTTLFALGRGINLIRVSSNFGRAIVEPERFTADPSEKPDLGVGPVVTQEFVETMILSPLGAGAGLSLWLFSGLAMLGLISLLLQQKFKSALLLTLWLLLPIASILIFLIHRGTFFAARYIISVLPAYLLLITAGMMALPTLLRRTGPTWLSVGVLILIGGMVFADMASNLNRLYVRKDKEDWHLVADFVRANAGPNDAIIPVRAERVFSWYVPPPTVPGNYYDDLAVIQETVANADRSWVILSIFSSGIDARIKAWLSDGEQGAVRFGLDPIITVYYLGHNTDKEQLLQEIRTFELPRDHAIFASLARENRRHPEIARRYYELAIEHAPDEETRTAYQTARQALE